MSDRSVKARARIAIGTSSICTATLGSTPMEKAVVPMPRMEMLEFCGCSAGRTTRAGATLFKSVNSTIDFPRSSAPPSTCTAAGTFCTFSARLLAVTITSPVRSASLLSVGCDCVPGMDGVEGEPPRSCAWAAPTASAATARAETPACVGSLRRMVSPGAGV